MRRIDFIKIVEGNITNGTYIVKDTEDLDKVVSQYKLDPAIVKLTTVETVAPVVNIYIRFLKPTDDVWIQQPTLPKVIP